MLFKEKTLSKRRNELQEWSRFLQAESHTLRSHPRFLFQQAANQPDSTAPAIAAKERSAQGLEKRPWFRWINKRQEVSSCLLTLNGSSGDISPDGSRIATLTGNNLKLWNPKTGQEISSYSLGGESGFFKFSQNSRRIAALKGSRLMLLDTAHGKILCEDDHISVWNGFQFSPDASLIISGHKDGTVKLRDTSTGDEIARSQAHSFGIDGCWFSPDGQKIISHARSELKCWHWASDKILWSNTRYDYGISRCVFSPDGTRFVAIINGELVVICKTSTGEEIKKIHLPDAHYMAKPHVVFTSQGIRIYSRNFYELDEEEKETDPSLRDGETGAEIKKLKGARDFEKLSQWAFSPNGEWLAIVSDYGTMQLLSSATGEVVRTFDEPKVTGSSKPVFLQDGAQIAAITLEGGDIQLWETQTGKKIAFLSEPFYQAQSIYSTHDGTLILSNTADFLHFQAGGVLKLWDVNAAMKQSTPPSGHTGEVTSCKFSPGSRHFATTSLDGNLILWEAESGSVKRKFKGPSDHMTNCAFSPLKPWIVGITPEGVVVIWEMDSGREVGVVQGGRAEDPSPWDKASLEFSPDGRILLTGGRYRPMKLWKADESEEFPLLSEAYGTSDLATFSPDGLQVLFIHRRERQTAGETVFWDATTGQEITRVKSLKICAYMPDGARIVGYDDKGSGILNSYDLSEELRFEEGRMHCDKYEVFPDSSRVAALRWDWKTRPEWRIWETIKGKIMYYLRVHSLKTSPSGKHLLIRSEDNFLELRDAATGSVLLSYKFFEDLKVLRWSPDGKRIVCGYGSGDVLLLEPQNIKFSAPVVTAWEKPKSRWNPLSKEKYAVQCPVCAQWSELPTFSPGEEMECPQCNERLALNSFTISGDWRELNKNFHNPQK